MLLLPNMNNGEKCQEKVYLAVVVGAKYEYWIKVPRNNVTNSYGKCQIWIIERSAKKNYN